MSFVMSRRMESLPEASCIISWPSFESHQFAKNFWAFGFFGESIRNSVPEPDESRPPSRV